MKPKTKTLKPTTKNQETLHLLYFQVRESPAPLNMFETSRDPKADGPWNFKNIQDPFEIPVVV